MNTPSINSPSINTAQLPACAGEDRYECDGECRGEFDSAYKKCLDRCLSSRCTSPTPESDRKDSRLDGRACLEVESRTCDDECLREPRNDRARCRRACLQSKCPDAGRYDTAGESVDPGTTRCNRCKTENDRRCRRQCRHNQADKPGWQNSLTNMGCEQLCLRSSCARECESPF